MIIRLKHITIKLELLTDVACFAYIAGKKNTKENKNDKVIHKQLKIIDWVERSFFIFKMQLLIIVNEYKNIAVIKK